MNEMKDNLNGQNDPIEGQEPVNINVDENAPGDQHLNEPVAEENELEKIKSQLDEKNDQYLRLAAEFDNFKRRTAKERIELIQTAGKDVITALLEVLDDSERAEQQLDKTEDTAQIREGIRLVFGKLRNRLAGRGLKPMEAKGTEFNADLHEAITEIPAGDEMKGKVVDEITKGYYLNDKIIRFAKVVVGK
jgi:molecular chaperone GrpE